MNFTGTRYCVCVCVCVRLSGKLVLVDFENVLVTEWDWRIFSRMVGNLTCLLRWFSE